MSCARRSRWCWARWTSCSTPAPLDTRAREALTLAQRNGRRLQRLVDTLLDFSQIEAGRMHARFQPVDLAAFTTELASFFDSTARKAGLTLQVDCPALPHPVYVDRSMWEKVVFNLLSNAIKYTPAGSVQAVAAPDRPPVCGSKCGTPAWASRAAALPHVFERFYRVEGAQGRSIEGTGIGLALVAELARMHGAQPQVESRLGAGSIFSLELPFGHAHLPASQVDHTPAEGPAGSARAGWLEDMEAWFAPDAPVQEPQASEALAGQRTGRAVGSVRRRDRPGAAACCWWTTTPTCASTWRACWAGSTTCAPPAMAGRHCSGSRESMPDLVLTDAMMGRMDGYTLLAHLRADRATATLPVIMLSADGAADARVQALDAGADDFLVKPFHARELLARVSGALRLAQVRREAMRARAAVARRSRAGAREHRRRLRGGGRRVALHLRQRERRGDLRPAARVAARQADVGGVPRAGRLGLRGAVPARDARPRADQGRRPLRRSSPAGSR